VDVDDLPRRVRVKFTVAPGCWPWHGATLPNGYGEIWDPVARKNRMAHRRVYELLVGPIAAGLQIDHLCRNKACVNPAHMEQVTSRENTVRHYRWVREQKAA
jgi:hypothetical protein